MQANTHNLVAPAEADSLETIRRFFEPLLAHLPDKQASLIIVALDECATNFIKHRSLLIDNNEISITAHITPASLLFTFGTFCHTSDLTSIKPRPLTDIRPGGLGTHFITQIMDNVTYEPDPKTPGAMNLILQKNIDPAPPKEATP